MPINLEVLASRHAANYPVSGTLFHLALILDTRSSFVFTAASSTDVITCTGHNFLNGTRVQVSGSTLPTPLVSTATYYVRDVTSSTFKLAITAGGAAIDLTTNGSGTLTITDVALTDNVGEIAQWIRKEVPSYQGATTRQTYVPTAPTTDYSNHLVRIDVTAFFDNSGGAAAILYDKVLIVKNGVSTRGNTTGTYDSHYVFGSTQTIAAGEKRGIKIPNILANA